LIPLAAPIFADPTASASMDLQFEFDPSTLGNESATYVIRTSAGDFTLNLTGTGTSPVSLARTSLNFGQVMEGTGELPLRVGVWNFGQNVQLLGITSSGPNAADFQLQTAFTPGQLIPLAAPIFADPTASASMDLQFEFDPSTVGTESATFIIHTSAGDLTLTLTGTGTSPVSLSHSTMDFGALPVGTQSTPLGVGLWNFGNNVQILGITSSGPNAGDFQLLTAFTPGQVLPIAQPIGANPTGGPSLELFFAFTPSTTGSETVTYTIHTTAGDLTITLTGTGT
jgi:hypothetical protein